MKVIITDSALESLAFYCGQSTATKARAENALAKLRCSQLPCRVLKLTGLSRPFWHHAIDDENGMYFVIGLGFNAVEARIFQFGLLVEEESSMLGELMLLSGEVAYDAIPEHVEIEEHAAITVWPGAPEEHLRPDGGLSEYLASTTRQLEEHGSSRPAKQDELNGRPYRLLTEIRSPVDLEARLSGQQRDVLFQPRPLLIQGPAGSGKTTMLTHFVKQELPRHHGIATALIIAYTEELKVFIRRNLDALGVDSKEEGAAVEVRTWRELCGQIAHHIGLNPIEWVSEGFLANYIRSKLPESCPANQRAKAVVELSEMFRSVLKGNSRSEDQSLETWENFSGLKRLPTDEYMERIRVYEIAQGYQYEIRRRNLWDDMDAARILLTDYRKKLPTYDFVLLDEVQDYTQVQLRLVAALTRRSNYGREPEGLVFAGDMDQVLYPSQFSWDSVRSSIWSVFHVPAPQVQRLNLNFCNPRPVTDFAEEVLKLRANRCGTSRVESPPNNQPLTPTPIKLRVKEGDLDALLSRIAGRIGSIGIIDREPRKLMVDGVEVQRCFTPSTVKGLEFNVVCLVRFNETYRGLVQPAGRTISVLEMFQKFNEVYVSITRTRSQLVLIDTGSQHDGIWETEGIRSIPLSVGSADDAVQLICARYSAKSRSDWRRDAMDFEAQRAYPIAGECWERAGDLLRAAQAYERAGNRDSALRNYMALGDHENSARICLGLGKFREAAMELARAKEFERAAKCWLQANGVEQAAKCYELDAERTQRLEDWERAARTYLKAGKHSSAARAFGAARMWKEAAAAYCRDSDYLHAAEICLQSGDPKEAARYYAEHYDLIGDTDQAVRHWMSVPEMLKATASLQRAGREIEACHLLAGNGHEQEAAKLAERIGEGMLAARYWARCRNKSQSERVFEVLLREDITPPLWEQVADEYEEAGMADLAARAYAQCGRLESAADLCSRSGNTAQAARYRAQHFDSTGDHIRASSHWIKAGEIERAGESLATAGNAAAGCELLAWHGHLSGAAELAERAGERKLSAIYWVRAGYSNRASKAIQGINPNAITPREWVDVAEECRRANLEDLAARCFANAGPLLRAVEAVKQPCDPVQSELPVAESREAVGKFEEAAQHWNDLGEIDRAVESFRKAGRLDEAGEAGIGRTTDAAKAAEELQDWRLAACYWAKAEDYLNSQRTFGALEATCNDAGEWIRLGALYRAAGFGDLAVKADANAKALGSGMAAWGPAQPAQKEVESPAPNANGPDIAVIPVPLLAPPWPGQVIGGTTEFEAVVTPPRPAASSLAGDPAYWIQRGPDPEELMAAKDFENAARRYEEMHEELKAASLWIRLRKFLRATEMLDLAERNDLAALAHAMFFFDKGNITAARTVVNTIGRRNLSKDDCEKILAGIHEEAFRNSQEPDSETTESCASARPRTWIWRLLSRMRGKTRVQNSMNPLRRTRR